MNLAVPAPQAPPAAAERHGGRILLLYALTMVLALPVLLFLSTERYSTLARLLAWLGLGFSLAPVVVMLARPRTRMNCIAGLGLVVALFYHLAPLHEHHLQLRWGHARLSDSSVEWAMFLAAFEVPALWLGWFLVGLLPPRLFPRLRLSIPDQRLRWTGYFIVLTSLAVELAWLAGVLTDYQPIVSLISVCTPLEMGFAMLLLYRDRAGNKLKDQGLLITLFVLVGGVALARGVMSRIIQPVLLYILYYLYVKRRLIIMPLVLGAGLMLLMQPVKAEFRQRVWDKQSDVGIAGRVELYLDLISEYWLSGDDDMRSQDAGSKAVEVTASRVGGSMALANVLELTPATVPHQWGATLQYLTYAWVPRVLYPDKPIAQYADVWAAVMYGYTTVRGTQTVMVGLSQLAESYINFGVVGSLLWLLMTGGLYRFFDELMAHEGAGTGSLALYLYMVLAVMFNSEGSFAQFFGGVLQLFVFYSVTLGLLGRVGVDRAAQGARARQRAL